MLLLIIICGAIVLGLLGSDLYMFYTYLLHGKEVSSIEVRKLIKLGAFNTGISIILVFSFIFIGALI